MNPLIAEFDRARLQHTLVDDAVHRRSLDLLEWETVTAQVARRCRTADGVAEVRATIPYTHPEPIQLTRDLGRELIPADASEPWPPIADVSCLHHLLGPEAPRRLEGPDLVRIATAAGDLGALRRYFLESVEQRPLWLRGARHLQDYSALEGRIRRTLDPDGQVRDDASPLLSRLRRNVHKGEVAARTAVNRIMQQAQTKGWTNGPEVTLRSDRFCIPLTATAKRRIQGLVHDRSSSGNTVFVEPAEVVQQQNDIVEMRLEMGAEIERIVLELNRSVQEYAEPLLEAARFMSLVDGLQAAVLWSRDLRANPPLIEAQGNLRIAAARHPILLETMGDVEAVTPLHLELARDRNVLVISGPNAGGKSVALKAVGILALVAQSGWDVPAAAGTELPLFKRFCVDLGDDQSIAASLSSFSAHLRHLAEFLELADDATLVLCDEIGSGTDPQEGTALALTILEELAERGCLVVASTHYGLLKAAVVDHPRMRNAAMAFDEQSLLPLYSLLPDVPGASHAFDIARRMALPEDVISRAQQRVGSDLFQLESLLADLGRRAREIEDTRQRLAELESRAARQDTELRDRLKNLDDEKSKLLANAQQQGETYLKEARRKIENVVRELRSSGADAKVIRYGKDTLQSLAETLPDGGRAPRRRENLKAGDRIVIPHLKMEGVVIEVRGERVIADARGLRLTLDLADVTGTGVGGEAVESINGAQGNWRGPQSSQPQEIDLRGYRAEEGWDALDLLIDRAIPAGFHQISIIHGMGTGRLREYLHQRLKSDPRVASIEEASQQSGGAGRTIAYLAD